MKMKTDKRISIVVSGLVELMENRQGKDIYIIIRRSTLTKERSRKYKDSLSVWTRFSDELETRGYELGGWSILPG